MLPAVGDDLPGIFPMRYQVEIDLIEVLQFQQVRELLRLVPEPTGTE